MFNKFKKLSKKSKVSVLISIILLSLVISWFTEGGSINISKLEPFELIGTILLFSVIVGAGAYPAYDKDNQIE